MDMFGVIFCQNSNSQRKANYGAYTTMQIGTLKQEILAETFRSKEEIEQEFKMVEGLKLAKERWKNDFTEAMQKASIEWHREHIPTLLRPLANQNLLAEQTPRRPHGRLFYALIYQV